MHPPFLPYPQQSSFPMHRQSSDRPNLPPHKAINFSIFQFLSASPGENPGFQESQAWQVDSTTANCHNMLTNSTLAFVCPASSDEDLKNTNPPTIQRCAPPTQCCTVFRHWADALPCSKVSPSVCEERNAQSWLCFTLIAKTPSSCLLFADNIVQREHCLLRCLRTPLECSSTADHEQQLQQ